MILDREPQFMAGLIKELNKIFGIETKLFITYYSQTDRQTEKTYQGLEQYLRIYINHR